MLQPLGLIKQSAKLRRQWIPLLRRCHTLAKRTRIGKQPVFI